jgi:GT2 family glycosyltransferase
LKETINVVIVTYNNMELLRSCVASVKKSLDNSEYEGQITVVDNASEDGTGEMIGRSFPYVNHVVNKENFGLAKALNIGIKQRLNSTYTLLLNDDVELFPETISDMVATLKEYAGAAGVPSCLIYPDGRPQRVKLRILGKGKKSYKGTQEIYFAGTTACMYLTCIFREIGFFDEFYFFYNEDLDFSLKAKRNGMSFVFKPEIKVIHHRKAGRNKATRSVKPYFYATDYYFYRKNFGVLFSSVYLMMAYIHFLRKQKSFKKDDQIENLMLLKEGLQRLRHTIKNYKKLRANSCAL